jgi:hypothetical protein
MKLNQQYLGSDFLISGEKSDKSCFKFIDISGYANGGMNRRW